MYFVGGIKEHRRFRLLVLGAVLFSRMGNPLVGADAPFLVEPYVQLGDEPRNLPRERLMVLWHSLPEWNEWSVLYRERGVATWKTAASLQSVLVAVPTGTNWPVSTPYVAPHRVW